jgi:hypothetical protein
MNPIGQRLLAALVAIAILGAIETVTIAGLISHHIPYPPDPLLSSIFFHYRKGVIFERELLLYIIGVLSAVIILGGLVYYFRRRLNDTSLIKALWQFNGVSLILVGLQIFAVFQIAFAKAAPWSIDLLKTLVIVSLLIQLFWLPLRRAFVRSLSFAQRPWIIDAAALLLIVVIIYIPDPQAVVAQFFLGDYFHTWDVVFMGAVYGIFKDLLPCVDMNATYGLGLPVVISGGMKLLGGFDYANALKVLVTLGIVYYMLWYLLLRRILDSRLMALAAILLAIRSQMFMQILVPSVWNEVQASILRFMFDVGFFWCLWLWGKHQKQQYLWGMAAFAALALYHMPTTGIWLVGTFLLYAGIHVIKGQGKIFAGPLVSIPLLFFIFLYATVATHVFTAQFWQRMTEWSSYFAHGFFYGQIFSAVTHGDLFKVILGLALIVLYTATLLYAGVRFVLDSTRYKDGLISMLAVYGLGLFTYYIGMSHKYGSVALPAVFILAYWVDRGLSLMPLTFRSWVKAILLCACLFSLAASALFRSYPNLLNVSTNPIVDKRTALTVGAGVPYFHQLSAGFPEHIKLPVNSLGQKDEEFKYEHNFPNHAALKDYYQKETAFSEDAALIKRFTSTDQKVPLLSSFEVMILSKADRKPFFYYFPLLNSHPMRMRNFVVTTIFSYPQLENCLKQLDTEKPPYVFIEAVFLTPQVPAWYGEEYEDLIGLIRYVLANYEPVTQGKYLVAMKRKL